VATAACEQGGLAPLLRLAAGGLQGLALQANYGPHLRHEMYCPNA